MWQNTENLKKGGLWEGQRSMWKRMLKGSSRGQQRIFQQLKQNKHFYHKAESCIRNLRCHWTQASPGWWWRWQWRQAGGTGGSDGSTSDDPSRRAGSRRPRSGQNACTDPAPSHPAGSPSAACGGRWRWLVGNCWIAYCSSEEKGERVYKP